MSQAGQIGGFQSHVFPLDALRRRSRSVQVRVSQHGVEADCFSLSYPSVLRAELRNIFSAAPEGQLMVEFTGVEEAWLPLGLSRVRRETELKNLNDALIFLAA